MEDAIRLWGGTAVRWLAGFASMVPRVFTGVVVLTFFVLFKKKLASFFVLLYVNVTNEKTDSLVGVLKTLVEWSVVCVGMGVALGVLGVDLVTIFTTFGIFGLLLGVAFNSVLSNFFLGLETVFSRNLVPGETVLVRAISDEVLKVLEITFTGILFEEEHGFGKVWIPHFLAQRLCVRKLRF